MGIPGRRPLADVTGKPDHSVATLVCGDGIDRTPILESIDAASGDTFLRLVVETAVKVRVHELVTPGINAARAPAGGLLPLLLGRQPASAPGGVGMGVPKVHSDDRAIRIDLTPEEGASLLRRRMILVPLFRRITRLLGRLVGMAQFCGFARMRREIAEEFRIFGDGHLVTADPEFGLIDLTGVLEWENPRRHFDENLEVPHLGTAPHHEESY